MGSTWDIILQVVTVTTLACVQLQAANAAAARAHAMFVIQRCLIAANQASDAAMQNANKHLMLPCNTKYAISSRRMLRCHMFLPLT